MLTLTLLISALGAGSQLGASNDPLFPRQWGLAQIRVEQAWSRTTGAGVVVAVIDTGADFGHPDLAGQLIKGRDFVNNDDDPQDDEDHGTHVTGIIVAKQGNGAGISGVAPRAKVLAIKVLDADGFGTTSDVISGIRYALQNGARVINLSLGDVLPAEVLHDPSYDQAIEDAFAAGVVVVAAAGNQGYPFADPATAQAALVVGATNRSDTRADYSNAGPGVNIWAPGGEGLISVDQFFCSANPAIWSTVRRGQGDCSQPDYNMFRGTSMASPHVAGVAALVRSANPSLTAAQVRQIILETADTISGGLKRVNAEKAVAAAGSPTSGAGSGGGQSPSGGGSTPGGGSAAPGGGATGAPGESPGEEGGSQETGGGTEGTDGVEGFSPDSPDEQDGAFVKILLGIAVAFVVIAAAGLAWTRLRPTKTRS